MRCVCGSEKCREVGKQLLRKSEKSNRALPGGADGSCTNCAQSLGLGDAISGPKLSTLASGEALFLTENGQQMKPRKVTDMVSKYVNWSVIDKKGACHLLLDATATEMLRHGADIREVRDMLRHSDISSTQTYAHVTIKDLNRVYYEMHLAAIGRRPHHLIDFNEKLSEVIALAAF